MAIALAASLLVKFIPSGSTQSWNRLEVSELMVMTEPVGVV